MVGGWKTGSRSKIVLWKIPTPSPALCEDSCLDVEACGEEDLATGACSLVQYVGWLDPVSRHGDGIAAYKKLQRFLSP
jgi:hypothetical protein